MTDEAVARRDKAHRARQRSALKRRKAQLLRWLAENEDLSAEIDERLAAQLEGAAHAR